MIHTNCQNCSIGFCTYPSRLKKGKGKFCSKKCFDVFQKGHQPWNTGKKCSSLSVAKTGPLNPMWKGGVEKKDSDKRYAHSQAGIEAHQRANLKYNKKPENKQKRNKWAVKKRSVDIHYKIKRNISNGIWCRIVRQRGYKKDQAVAKCLPYTIEELKCHLEGLFLLGMTWGNYGKWHIDHIKPDSSFEYKSTLDPGFQESWALDNLQPLWAVDNLKKGNKIIIK